MSIDTRTTVTALAPAKLNLFLELLGKRDDGYHEIDTVMVAIDLSDQLTIRRTVETEIRLNVDWLPSKSSYLQQLGISNDPNTLDPRSQVAEIPTDSTNLVYRAIDEVAKTFDLKGGFELQLNKKVPAGAGLGGASSDAATAIMATVKLCGLDPEPEQLVQIAASIGSDVPFFLGFSGQKTIAAWATGRGEKVKPITLPESLHFIIVYPGVVLSTAQVYQAATIPRAPLTSEKLRSLMSTGAVSQIGQALNNRLSQPAEKLAPQIKEILVSMWQTGLKACQLTGSGSACFALAASRKDAELAADRLRERLTPGALVTTASTLAVPVSIKKQLH